MTVIQQDSNRIQVRDLRFQLEGVPRHWHGGRRSVTNYFDNLSIFFPPGERFFVATLKRFRDQIHDPALREAVDAFCAQEGHHSREHVRYNRMLREQGYPAEAMEGRVDRLLRKITRLTSAKRQLAATAALEHFTTLMAVLLLKDERNVEGAHPTMAALWTWHAAEENEHKSVAFDAYQAVGGSWGLRCRVMVTTTLLFWTKVFEHQVRLMHHDAILFSPREWWALFRFLFVFPGGMRSLLRPYLAWYRLSFHPSQLDHTELLERWRAGFQHSTEYQRAVKS